MPEESKDSLDEAVFHYKREERTAALPETIRNRDGKKVPFFKRNRSLAITLIDVGVLLLLFLIVYPLLQNRKNLERWGPYEFTLRAIDAEEDVLLNLKVQVREAALPEKYPQIPDWPVVIQGRYQFDLNPETPVFSGVLEMEEDAVQFFRIPMAGVSPKEKVYLALELPDTVIHMETRIE